MISPALYCQADPEEMSLKLKFVSEYERMRYSQSFHEYWKTVNYIKTNVQIHFSIKIQHFFAVLLYCVVVAVIIYGLSVEVAAKSIWENIAKGTTST